MTFTALLKCLGFPKSSLHALLEVMVTRGYIELAPDTRIYTLGMKSWENSQAYLNQHQVIGEALKVMESIRREINETVQLAALDGTDNVYLAKVDSTHRLRLQSEVGGRLHAHATGLGKVLLAYLQPLECQRRYKGVTLQRITPNTISDRSQLFAELNAIRQRGFGIDNEEYTPGLFCLAVPVHHGIDQAMLAMSISIPILRVSLGGLAVGLSLLARGSLEIAKRTGSLFCESTLAGLVSRDVAEQALTSLTERARYQLPFNLSHQR